MDNFKTLLDSIPEPIDDTDRKAAKEACKRQFQGTNSNLRAIRPSSPTNNCIDAEDPFEGLTLGEGLKLLQKTVKPKFGPLDHLPCANVQVNKYTACERPGVLFCSRCKLVAYCTKECQIAHWKTHKIDCHNRMLSEDWKPGYEVDQRTPNFIGDEFPSEEFRRLSFGMSLWGNMPARNVVNLPKNENNLRRDLNLAFIASGDLRNIMKTIVDLPEGYTGKVEVLLNDFNPAVFNRNLLILLILVLVEDERLAVDIALHFWYSVFIPIEYQMQISATVVRSALPALFEHRRLSLGSSSLTIDTPDNDWLLYLFSFTRLDHGLSLGDIQSAYDRVRLAPSKADFRDRQYAHLRPSHRVAFQEFRRFGLVLPFGAVNVHFDTPNLSLFSPEGEWLQTDHADPLDGYDIQEVLKSGKAHGGRMEDIYGCLYFHISDQLQMLAKRIKSLSISFHLTQTPAQQLVEDLREGKLSKNGLAPTVKFDRIDLSNILDDNYVGIEPLLTKWKPFLADTKHAAIIGYFMNWSDRTLSHGDNSSWQPTKAELRKAMDACIEYGDKHDSKFKAFMESHPSMLYETISLARSLLFKGVSQHAMFLENSRGFRVYLRARRLDQILKRTQLVRRTNNKVFPHRLGLDIDDPEDGTPHFKDFDDFYYNASLTSYTWTERYVEFCHA